MINLKHYASVILLCFIVYSIDAQKSETIKPEVHLMYAKKIGTTKPLKELVPRAVTDNQKKSLDKSKIRIPKNFIGRHPSRIQESEKVQTGPDKIRQWGIYKSRQSLVEPKINVEGLTVGSSPQDPSGDVGENFYVQGINITTFGIFNKSDGSLEMSFAGNTLWNSLGFTSAGDPIILYDQEVNRWILTEFSNQGNNMLVAVSEDSDPRGAYDVYNFTTPRFPDYPKYSIWKDSYTVTTNEQGAGVLHAYFINKEELLAGADQVSMQRVNLPGNSNTEAGFYVATPVDWSGEIAPPSDRDPIFLALNDASWNTNETEDKIEIFSVDVDWIDENNTSMTQYSLPISPFDSYPCAAAGFGFSCIPQLGGFGLDGIPEVIMNQVHYRNFGSHESMVLNFITDVTDGENLSGIRWMELRRTIEEDWTVYQEGTFAPDDGLHRFMGGIAIDGSGNIGLAYNVSSPNDYVGVRFTGRRSSDPLGEMTVDEYDVVQGSGTISSGGRFGDYAHMTIDPFDDKTFWYTTEYAGENNVLTRILSFELKQDTFDIGPINLKTPVNASLLTDNEEVQITIENFGLETLDSFSVGYIFESDPEVIEEVKMSLAPNEQYVHTFDSTVDVSKVGTYAIKLFTSLNIDQNILNDTVLTQIINIPQNDLELLSIEEIGLVCGSNFTAQLNFINLGTSPIEEAILKLTLNGNDIGQQVISGPIATNEIGSVDIPIIGIEDGDNIFSIQVGSVNGIDEDEILINNNAAIDFIATLNGFVGNVSVTLDDFSEETSWTLEDENGYLVATGGPYDGQDRETVNTEVCLDPNLCYVFTFMDSYGDGITFGQRGSYEITNDEGAVLASIIDASFGSEEVNEFCALFMCAIEAEANSSPTSDPNSSDGVIIVNVTNGAGPFLFSIDEGNTFQDDNTFSGLQQGDYEIVVEGSGGCTFEMTASVAACNVNAAITVVPESAIDSNDGEIILDITGTNGSALISINGGVTLGTETEYTGLEADDYEVFIRDSLGCTFLTIVHVGNSVSNGPEVVGAIAKIYPNPTEGIFRIELIGVNSNEVYIPMTLYNLKGEVIQRNNLAKYDSGYQGIMSLYHYPAGAYFVKIEHYDFNSLIRVVRQ
ncbi:MAG: T9SS type A sorting domain-containing protein [Saprospiraceae bacterium]|nr:T9SS type A sorting domain-containing protein [Saprospiraceae bacterium]